MGVPSQSRLMRGTGSTGCYKPDCACGLCTFIACHQPACQAWWQAVRGVPATLCLFWGAPARPRVRVKAGISSTRAGGLAAGLLPCGGSTMLVPRDRREQCGASGYIVRWG